MRQKPSNKSKTPKETELSASVDAIVRLMESAKRQGISSFEGPAGLKFTFRRDSLKPPPISGVKEEDDGWLP